MYYKKFTGNLGEDIAAQHLGSKGYDILYRNKRYKWGELDLITKAPDKTLVFIEVKTLERRKSVNTVHDDELMPEDNLTQAKLRKLKRTAQLFAGSHPELIDEERGWRIDLLAIELPDQVIRHYENIS